MAKAATKKPKKAKEEKAQTSIVEDDIEDAFIEVEDSPTRSSQAKVAAELTSISMSAGRRVFALKITSPKMIEEMMRIFKQQKAFMIKFKVPVEKENDEVTQWEEVEFETRLIDLSLKSNSATCHGHIDHEGACVMSQLIHNWKSGVEFFLDGIQQSLF